MYKARLRLRIAHDLFSSFDVDAGSRLLLRTLAESGVARAAGRVLDLGCGYGPLGLMVKAWNPACEVVLVDRDSLAVEYAAANAALNGVTGGVVVRPSLGYDEVGEGGFDLVVSNLPAKAGTPVLESFLDDARWFLAPGGTVAVVAIDRIAPEVEDVLRRDGKEIVLEKRGHGYSVWYYRFVGDGPEDPYRGAFERGVYRRGEREFRLGGRWLDMAVSHGLPEFDSLHFATELLGRQVAGLAGLRPSGVLAFNPGQGHVPVLASLTFGGAAGVRLGGRDLLAARTSAVNLERNGAGGAGEPAEVGLAVGTLPDREPVAVTRARMEDLAAVVGPGGTIVMAGSSTAVTRSVEGRGVKVVDRVRNRGLSAATLTIRG